MAKSFTLTCPKQLLECAIPDFDVLGGNLAWVTARTKQAIDGWLSVPEIPQGGLPEVAAEGESIRMMLSFGGAAEMMLRTLARQTGLTESEVARRIVGLLAQQGLSEPEDQVPVAAEDFVEILRMAGYRETRPEQISFYLQNKASLNGGKIGLSEAATGTGKTASMLCVAAETANSAQARVVITVPTLALIHQFKRTYTTSSGADMSLQDAIAARLGAAPPLRSIFGRREFVSEAALQELLASGELDPPQLEAARDWLTSAQATGMGNPDAWLVSGLDAAVGSEFPLDDVRLSEFVLNEDRGYLAYREQMAHDEPHEAEIVLITHAMLGVDLRARLFAARKDEEYQEISELIATYFNEFVVTSRQSRELRKGEASDAEHQERTDKRVEHSRGMVQHYEAERGRLLGHISEEYGVIPPFRYLMVDECHQFESSLSRVLSNYVSLRLIGRELKDLVAAGGKVTGTAIKQAGYAIRDILACSPAQNAESRDGETVLVNSTYTQERHPNLLPAIRTLVNVLDSMRAPPKDGQPEAVRLYVALKRDLSVLKSVANGSYGMLSFSPVRKFPQLMVGRPSMEAMLRQLWASVEGASCVSATIYLPKGDSQTGWYLKSILAIPDHREAEYTPSAGAWIFRPIAEVWQPNTPEDIASLTPPSTKTLESSNLEVETDRWHAAVADTLASKILPSAAGGVLALCTSYQTCEAVGKALEKSLKDVSVIYAQPKFSLSAQKQAFIAARRENRRAVWIATGGAWTGLDISGKDIGLEAAEDNLLTDLVIPRLPFNTNRSITHQHRKIYRPSTSWEIFETCFALRQALGRLVRRFGLPKNRRIWLLDGRLKGRDAARLQVFQKVLDRFRPAA